MADVRTIQATPVAANFASPNGSPLVWDAAGQKAYMLANGDIVVELAPGVPYTGANADVDIGAHSFSAKNITLTGTAGVGYMDFIAQSANPAAPSAGTLRFHSSTTQGFTRFEQDNEAPTNIVLGRDSVFIAKNTSGGTINPMTPVYVTGSTGNVPNIGKAKADVIGTLPGVGLALDSIVNNNFGQVMRLGVMANVNTSAFTAGDLVFVSKDTAGVLTKTRPVSPNLAQAMAVVLVSGVGNGSLFVITAPFIGGQESGTTSAWLAASTIKPAQATPNAYLSSDNSAGITGTLTTASLVGKTLTFKDGIITAFA